MASIGKSGKTSLFALIVLAGIISFLTFGTPEGGCGGELVIEDAAFSESDDALTGIENGNGNEITIVSNAQATKLQDKIVLVFEKESTVFGEITSALQSPEKSVAFSALSALSTTQKAALGNLKVRARGPSGLTLVDLSADLSPEEVDALVTTASAVNSVKRAYSIVKELKKGADDIPQNPEPLQPHLWHLNNSGNPDDEQNLHYGCTVDDTTGDETCAPGIPCGGSNHLKSGSNAGEPGVAGAGINWDDTDINDAAENQPILAFVDTGIDLSHPDFAGEVCLLLPLDANGNEIPTATYLNRDANGDVIPLCSESPRRVMGYDAAEGHYDRIDVIDDDSYSSMVGYPEKKRGSEVNEYHGHGGKISGYMAAARNAAGTLGVCPNCKVLGMKTLSGGGNAGLPLTTDNIEDAFARLLAYKENHPEANIILSMSLVHTGGPSGATACNSSGGCNGGYRCVNVSDGTRCIPAYWYDNMQDILDAGILVLAAAGNYGNYCTPDDSTCDPDVQGTCPGTCNYFNGHTYGNTCEGGPMDGNMCSRSYMCPGGTCVPNGTETCTLTPTGDDCTYGKWQHVTYPAADPRVLAVGASSIANKPVKFTSGDWGARTIDVWAPGESVVSIRPRDNNDGTVLLSGHNDNANVTHAWCSTPGNPCSDSQCRHIYLSNGGYSCYMPSGSGNGYSDCYLMTECKCYQDVPGSSGGHCYGKHPDMVSTHYSSVDFTHGTPEEGKLIDAYGDGVHLLNEDGSHSYFGDGEYSVGNGTSYASPIAAGVAGLIWAKRPDWNADQVKAHLLDTGHDFADVSGDDSARGKLPDVAAALAALSDDDEGDDDDDDGSECEPAGDITGDGAVNVLDIVALVSFVLGPSGEDAPACGDMTNDGVINVLDIVAIVNLIME
ncbi:MAG: S8 family serine peptidase [Myxococcota bacterium]|nr:S8 family serine peptidase [Myxococcota bacterium]